MEIKTKYNIGDKVWVVSCSLGRFAAEQGEVSAIDCIYVRDKNKYVHHCIIYEIDGLGRYCHNRFHEHEVFETKEEAEKEV